MQILMIRHSIAEDWSEGGDFGRELTPEGRDRFAAAAAWLQERGIIVSDVLHSPRIRAVQTAELLAEAMGVPQAHRYVIDFLGGHYSLQQLSSTLLGCGGPTIAVVGHMPTIGETTGRMIGNAKLHFAPGTIAAVDFDDDIDAGMGRLRWQIMPEWFADR